jgi:hypothetical protein
LWRHAGHYDDGLYSLEAENPWKSVDEKLYRNPHSAFQLGSQSLYSHTEVEKWKWVGGDFVVSPRHTAGPQGFRPVRMEHPTHNPYGNGWQGLAPSGRWVLDRGRPRCMSQKAPQLADYRSLPQSGEIQNSILFPRRPDRQRPHKVPALHYFNSDEDLEDVSAPVETSHSVVSVTRPPAMSFGPTETESYDRPSPCLGDSDSEDGDDASVWSTGSLQSTRSKEGLLASSTTGIDRRVKKGRSFWNSKTPRNTSKTPRNSEKKRSTSKRSASKTPRKASKQIKNDENTVVDINEILMPLEQHLPEEPPLQRFDWNNSRAVSNASVQKIQPVRPQKQKLEACEPGSGSSSAAAPPRRGSSTINEADGQAAAVLQRSESKYFDENQHIHQNRMKDRDQRSELRKLQQSLLSSGQQTFDAEVWEGCGIEAEHLKQQQLAAVLGSFFNFSGKKDDASKQDEGNAEKKEKKEVVDG